MKLRVHIVCPDCGHSAEVWVQGAWDIDRVHHRCRGEAERHYGGKPMKEGEFAVEFNPARRAY